MKNIGILFALAFSPVFAWFFICFAPLIFAVGLIVSAITLIGYVFARLFTKEQREVAGAKIPVLEPVYAAAESLAKAVKWSPQVLNSITEMIDEHLMHFAAPMKACACAAVEDDGKVKMFTRFVAAGGSWSHAVVGVDAEDALARTSWKLRSERSRTRSEQTLGYLETAQSQASCGGCQTFGCANAENCPNKGFGKSPYDELASVAPTESELDQMAA